MTPASGAGGRPPLVPLIVNGEPDPRYLGPAGTELARAHRESVIRELPVEAFGLGEGDPAIPTNYV